MKARTHPRRQPPRQARRGEDGRLLSSAGHGIAVAVLALAVGALLTAPGMHKSAFNQQPGVRRDVALAITGPLAGVSHALLLDRPRQLVRDAIGRDDGDRIDTEIALPPAAPVASAPAPAPPALPVFTPKRKLRLWVAGDSLVLTPGYSLVRAAGASPVIQSVGVDGRVGTGLERPDVFNWFTEIRAQVTRLRADVVVLGFGGNDDHRYMTGLPAGVTVDGFGTPSWRREYARRVGGLLDTVARAGAVAVWIGLPITRSRKQTQRFDIINSVVAREVRKRPGRAIYVDTYAMFAGDNGGYAEYLQGANGTSIKVRADDGVHLESAGGDMVARAVLKRLNETFDLTSWRRKR